MTRFLLEESHCFICCNAVNPGEKAAFSFELTYSTVDFNQCVLENIVGILVISNQSADVPVQAPTILVQEYSKPLFLVSRCSAEQLQEHVISYWFGCLSCQRIFLVKSCRMCFCSLGWFLIGCGGRRKV